MAEHGTYRDADDDRKVFVPVPGTKGHFIRTHICVATTKCDLCGSRAGEPCISNRDSHGSSTHVMRRESELIKCHCGVDYLRSGGGTQCYDCSMAAQKDRAKRRAPFYRVYSKALRSGELVRWETCSHCGGPPASGQVIDGHHPDYAKPLEVVWLCRSCHQQEHAHQLRRAAR